MAATITGAASYTTSGDTTRELALIYFEEWVWPRATLVQQQLRGWNLACWCKPPILCHVDVLLEIANTGLRYEAA